jgi:thioredoxin reductase
MTERDLVIIGAGPAGIAAAVSAYESGARDILILERDQYLGGILNQCIHTGFGLEHYKELLTGPEYAQRAIDEVKKLPIEISLKSFVVRINHENPKSKILNPKQGQSSKHKYQNTGTMVEVTYIKPGKLEQIKAKAVIMATGCRERTREMAHIPGTRPAGIYPAGLAQKMINIEGLLPGKEVVVVGSGDIGLIMARRFTLEGAKVKAVIELSDVSKGLTRNMVQCIEDFDIPVYFRHKISRIFGKDRVEKIDVIKVDDSLKELPGTEFSIDCDTILMSIGLIPENELIEAAGAEMDKKTNSPVSDGLNKTSIPGVFACGNCFKVYDIVDSVTKDSILAGKLAAISCKL